MCQTLNRWLADQVPQVVRLAMLSFDRTVHEDFCRNIGWDVFREDWYPETCFEVHFDNVARRLVAVYDDSESGVGIGLYAVSGSRGFDDFYLSTLAEYDEAFRATLAQVTPHLPSARTIGAYRCQHSDHEFKYAYWPFPDTFMTLVQHFEGDGHAGHESSLDIRIVPRFGADQLMFPLTTNILF